MLQIHGRRYQYRPYFLASNSPTLFRPRPITSFRDNHAFLCLLPRFAVGFYCHRCPLPLGGPCLHHHWKTTSLRTPCVTTFFPSSRSSSPLQKAHTGSAWPPLPAISLRPPPHRHGRAYDYDRPGQGGLERGGCPQGQL